MATPYLSTDLLYPQERRDTKVEQDEYDPLLYDVVVLEVGCVRVTVVTDFKNKSVKSFYITNKKTSCSRLQLNDEPNGITQLGTDKVLVAVPGSRQIVTVTVTPDLVYEKCINTSTMYFSLTVMTPSICAAGGNDSVDILNLQGEVLKSVTTHNNMELFKRCWYMCISNTGHLLVSDGWEETVTCLTSEGEIVWIYSGTGRRKLSFPTGITTTGGGDILVADTDLKKVIQLSESGEYVRDVLTSQDGLSDPMGICVDKHDTLYICDSGNLFKCVAGKR